ncbi:uncharacterized protein LOC143184566 [Calliopsis andreniformis]|uniref:uncharacterized protein LOC143184566 n=1 Tax=Calliopsis andreniformis TaxID=337506 RepID=UPI003FCEDEA5
MEKHFASLKLLDSDNDRTLTRAHSHLDLPSAAQIYGHQTHYYENPFGLVRQYSCEQIFNDITKTRQVKISEVIQSGYRESRNEWHTILPHSEVSTSSNWQFGKSSNLIQPQKLEVKEPVVSVEYMEVENLSNVKESEVSSNCQILNSNISNSQPQLLSADLGQSEKKGFENVETETKAKNTSTYNDIKKKLRPLVSKSKTPVKKKINMCCWNLICLCLLPIVVAIISLVLNPVTYNICSRTNLFSNATHEIQQKIYGQQNAVYDLTYALNRDIHLVKVICLIGGTGVGKSYTMEIIRKNVPFPDKIFVHNSILENQIDTKTLSSFGSYNLLVLENLKMKDLGFLVDVVDVLKNNNDKCITVFAIFNVEETDSNLIREVDLIQSKNTILNTLGTGIDISVISYQPLNEQALEMCIMEAAELSNLKLTENQVNTIKESLLTSGSGCKGAYAKVQVIGRESIWF